MVSDPVSSGAMVMLIRNTTAVMGTHRTEGFHNLFLEPFIHCIAPLLYNLCIIITEKNGIAKPDFVLNLMA